MNPTYSQHTLLQNLDKLSIFVYSEETSLSCYIENMMALMTPGVFPVSTLTSETVLPHTIIIANPTMVSFANITC